MRSIRVFSLFSIVLFSLAVLHAQNNGAMAYAHGDVTLNGQAVSSSTTIATGDRLDTADSSVVTINRPGSSIVVNPNSSIQYGQSSIEIMRGTARLSTLAGMSAQAGQLTVTPKDGMAKFDIVRSDDGTSVTTREGALTLRDGSRTVTLEPGTTTLFASSYRDGEAGILPVDRISTFNTALLPDIPICDKVKLCFGVRDASETHPCRCHSH